MSNSQTLSVTIPSNEWVTSNMRFGHHMAKATRTKALRQRAKLLARAQNLRQMEGPVIISVSTFYRGGRGLDADNVQPTVKALVDGIVDAGILGGDDAKWVIQIIYNATRRDPTMRKGDHRVELLLIDQAVPF